MPNLPGEFELIKLLTGFIKNKDPSIVRDFGDDTAFIKTKGGYTLLTVDTLVEGVHFLRNYPADAVGWKLVSVNVSDVAAKGGKPLYGLITLALPEDVDLEYLKNLYRGVAAALKFYNFSLVGGNTTSSEKLCLDLSLVGFAERAIFRDTPKVGDRVFVSGTLGDSRAGLEILLSEKKGLKSYERKLVEKHLRPRARTDLSNVVKKFANASMDISDGFLGDLKKMCKDFTVEVFVEKLPISQELKLYCNEKGLNPYEYALLGGEDYELLVSSSVDLSPFGFTEVGRVISEGEGKVLTPTGQELKGEGFDHLRG
jgi:thiamine-monophosphate kinase